MLHCACVKSRGEIMENSVVVWKDNFPTGVSLSMAFRKIILWGVPSLSFLGLVGIASWRWYYRGKKAAASTTSSSSCSSSVSESATTPTASGDQQDSATACLTVGGSSLPAATAKGEARQSSSPVSVDSGVMDEGSGSSQGCRSRKTSTDEETALRRGSGEDVKPAPSSKQMASSNLHLPSMESEGPLVCSSNTTAIPPIERESSSEMEDSTSSSEGILTGSQTSKSPGYYDRVDISPHTEAQTNLQSSANKNPPSASMPSRDIRYYTGGDAPDVSKTNASQSDSKEVPVVCQKERIRVIIHIPRDVVGRFIGKLGRNIKALMADSKGAHVYVNQKNLPKDAQFVLCTVQGSVDQVNEAMKLIEARYPEIQIPDFQSSVVGSISFSQVTSNLNFTSPRSAEASWDVELQPASIPTMSFSGLVSYIENLTTVWLVACEKSLQLDQQHHSMSYTYCYTSGKGQGVKPRDTTLLGKCCAVRVSDIHWLRGRVCKFGKDSEIYEVQLVDYGSIVAVPPSEIKPLRKEHSLLPVQAFKSRMAHVEAKEGMLEGGMLKLQSLVENMELEVHISGVISIASPAPTPTPPPSCHSSGGGDTTLSTSPVLIASANGSKCSTPIPPRADATPFVPAQPSSASPCPNEAPAGPEEWSTLTSAPDTGDVSVLLKKIRGTSSVSSTATAPKETTPNDVHPILSKLTMKSDSAEVPMESAPNNAHLILDKLGGISSGVVASTSSKPPPTQSAADLLRQLGGGPRSDRVSPSEGKKDNVPTSPVLEEEGEEFGEQLVPLAPYIPLVELYAQLGANTPTFVNRELVDLGFATWKEDTINIQEINTRSSPIQQSGTVSSCQ